MADDEDKTTQGAGEQASQGGSGDDFEAKYKELQVKIDALTAEKKDVQAQYDLLMEYVDWDKVRGVTSPEQDSGEESAYKGETKDDSANKLAQLESRIASQMLAMQFRTDYPELRPYEDALVTPAVIRLRQKYPRKNAHEVLEMAVKEVKDLLEKERAKGKEAAEAKKAKAAETAGLESGGTTSPKPEDEGESPEEYVAFRQAIRNRKLQPGAVVP